MMMQRAAAPIMAACIRSGGSDPSVVPGRRKAKNPSLRKETNVPKDAISRSAQSQILVCSAARITIPLDTNPLKSGTPAIENAATQNAMAVTGIFFWSPPTRRAGFRRSSR